ncbi:AmmeMemoRadiSam system protein A [Candidatus Woesearchaeota archaeon]|nr:AmmeMemoRadiSam system protein A [Candidatus Woesearchaeota archaeon]
MGREIETETASLLLQLARKSVEYYFDKKEISEKELLPVKHLNQKRGVFITIKKQGNLRGCIGLPEPTQPLYLAVIEAARSAAFGDPRFPILIKDEMRKINFEVSILTKPKLLEVDDPEEYLELIEIGRHGLILRCSGTSSLLLPQVPVEQHWTVSQYLNALSQKAGLSFTAWHDEKDAQIFTFEAEVFTEVGQSGKVERIL